MAAHDIAAEPGEGRQVGETHRRRLQRQSHAEVGVVLHHDSPWLALLVRPSKAVSGAAGDVSHPGGDHPGHRARRDHLVECHVGNRTDQSQVTALLADDLMDGGERNARLEGEPEGDRIAVMHLLGDRVAQRAALVGFGCRHRR